jgi:hypothetical protein
MAVMLLASVVNSAVVLSEPYVAMAKKFCVAQTPVMASVSWGGTLAASSG